jgi:GT2 family glycosyltransferase
MLSLSIIIVNYRCWDRLAKCLNSIAGQEMTDLEVIIVDNFSNDGREDTFMVQYPWVKFIMQNNNGGFAQACNKGAEQANGKWLLFLNPDTILNTHVLKPLLERAEKEEDWKLIGIRQLNDNGRDTHPHGIFLKWWNVWAPVRSLERLIKGTAFSKNHLSTVSVTYPDWISGSFVLIRKTDMKQLGGWDERFWMYCEDMDLSKRAAELGWKRVMYNDISCIHSHGGSSRINPETKAITKTAVMMSTISYLKKYNSPVKFGFAIDMYFLPRIIEAVISYPFSPLTRAIVRRFLRSKIN